MQSSLLLVFDEKKIIRSVYFYSPYYWIYFLQGISDTILIMERSRFFQIIFEKKNEKRFFYMKNIKKPI